jgi:hypothetical protein
MIGNATMWLSVTPTFNTLTVVMIAAADAKPFNTGREINETINPNRSSPKMRQNRPTNMVMART